MYVCLNRIPNRVLVSKFILFIIIFAVKWQRIVVSPMRRAAIMDSPHHWVQHCKGWNTWNYPIWNCSFVDFSCWFQLHSSITMISRYLKPHALMTIIHNSLQWSGSSQHFPEAFWLLSRHPRDHPRYLQSTAESWWKRWRVSGTTNDCWLVTESISNNDRLLLHFQS